MRRERVLRYVHTDITRFLGRRVLVGAGMLVLAVQLLPSALYVQGLREDDLTFGQYLFSSVNASVLPLTLAGLVVGYEALAAHRERDSIRLLLAAPYTRREVFVGAYVSRVLGASLIAFLAVAASVALGLTAARPAPSTLATASAVVALTVAYAALWAGVAVSVSALSSTNRRAVLALLGVAGAVVVLWPLVQMVTGLLAPELSRTLRLARPVDGYWILLESVAGGVEGFASGGGASVRQVAAAVVFGALWFVCPAWYAARRFAATDV